MRTLALLSAFISAGTALADGVTVPLAGPRANPDDQARYCWYMVPRYYTNALAAGFNTYIGSLSSTWYTLSSEKRRKELSERLDFLAQLERDGVDGLEQVKIHANKGFREQYARVRMDGTLNKGSVDCNRADARAIVDCVALNIENQTAVLAFFVEVHNVFLPLYLSDCFHLHYPTYLAKMEDAYCIVYIHVII